MGEAIALGFCNNVDCEIDLDLRILQNLALHYRIRSDEVGMGREIASERDLVCSILGFMRSGEGGERFVRGSGLIEQFAGRFAKKITLGGTSVRAAIAMGKLGYAAALHLITLNDHARRLLPANCPYVCSNAKDSYYPHLIVQFDEGDRLQAGDLVIRATRPNRLIYHCNADRLEMKINPDFADLIADARVLLVSGFNAMQSERLLQERLATVARLLDVLPSGAAVFLEDGGYHTRAFKPLVYGALRSRLSVYSMNEDEFQAHLGRRVNVSDAGQTRAALAALHKRLGIPTLVLHRADWALAYGDGAERYAEALKAGVAMATTRFRHGDDFTFEQYRSIAQAAPLEENARFAQALNASAPERICCVPVPAVEQAKPTTIGLGDAFVGGFLPALL